MNEIRLLGPVELWNGSGQIPAGPPQQRCVLAVLALTPGQPVPLATLIDRLWDDQLPRDARSALRTTVSRLRRAVAALGGSVWYNSGGYQLGFDPDHIDLHRVRRLATRARELVGSGRHGAADASSLLAEACAQWRGTPLSGLKGDWADRVRTGLDHERLSLLTARFEADLACGRHTAAVGPLAAAYAEYPLAESLAGLLMLALHHTGRQAEALTVFTRIRRRLIDQIGDEPGKALQNLHARLLRRDPP